MSAGIHIHVTRLKETQKEMRRIGAKFAMRKYLDLIGNHLLDWVDTNFKTEGKAPGRLLSWKKLSPNTIAGRRKGSKKVLQDTGRLKQSFVSKVHRSAQRVSVGTPDKRAPWHHYGTGPYVIKPKKRKFLKFPVPVSARWPNGFAFVKQVWHPKVRARPLIPNEALGSKMALEVLDAYVDKVLKKGS